MTELFRDENFKDFVTTIDELLREPDSFWCQSRARRSQ